MKRVGENREGARKGWKGRETKMQDWLRVKIKLDGRFGLSFRPRRF